MSSLSNGIITLDGGSQIEIDRCYNRLNRMDRLALMELQHRRGHGAIITGTYIGRFVHNSIEGTEVLVAHTITESRNVIEHDYIVIEHWMKEHAPADIHHKRKVRRKRSWMDEVHADLGMTKVRGAVSGKVYYE